MVAALPSQGLRNRRRADRSGAPQPVPKVATHADIANKAYELFLRRGGDHGRDVEIGLKLNVSSPSRVWRAGNAELRRKSFRALLIPNLGKRERTNESEQ